jgi:hypothetical protein
MGVLENYVMLETGIPTRLHFTDHRIQRRTVTDPVTGEPASRNVLVLDVDRMDGRPAVAKYSTMSEKHAMQFEPYLEGKRYRDYEFTITRTGEGFLTQYSVSVVPIT